MSGTGIAAGGPVITEDVSVCSNGTKLFELGAPVSSYYVRIGGVCQLIDVDAVATGAEIPLSRYERAVLATDGASQIAPARWVTSSGFRSPAGLFDTVHGDRCSPVVETGSVRYICGPQALLGGPYTTFTDAACNLSQSTMPACRRPWTASITTAGATPSTCEGTASDVFAYDVVTTAPQYDRTSAGCVPITTPILERSPTVIDATVLPRLQRVIR